MKWGCGRIIWFASIFGIADKVAKELHDIDPQFFEEVMAYDSIP